MHYPKISIITPSFNQGNYIEETIRSVIDQQYPNLEYIIMDGGSNDETVSILKKYGAEITHWLSEPDAGQTDAINKGFKLASGQIINWLNSDDYFAPGCLQKIADAFNNDQTKAVTTTVCNFIEGGDAWDELVPTQNSDVAYLCKTYNNQPGTFFRKEVWDKYFPMPVQLRFVMDQYLWLCFWIEHSPANLATKDFLTVNFRRHAASKTTISGDSIFKSLGLMFFDEYNLLFWSFFKQFAPAKANALESYFGVEFNYRNKQITFPGGITPKPGMCDEIFNLYLFELAKEDYRCGFADRFKATVANINDKSLSQADLTVLKKMRQKMRSPLLLKLYRKIYWLRKIASPIK